MGFPMSVSQPNHGLLLGNFSVTNGSVASSSGLGVQNKGTSGQNVTNGQILAGGGGNSNAAGNGNNNENDHGNNRSKNSSVIANAGGGNHAAANSNNPQQPHQQSNANVLVVLPPSGTKTQDSSSEPLNRPSSGQIPGHGEMSGTGQMSQNNQLPGHGVLQQQPQLLQQQPQLLQQQPQLLQQQPQLAYAGSGVHVEPTHGYASNSGLPNFSVANLAGQNFAVDQHAGSNVPGQNGQKVHNNGVGTPNNGAGKSVLLPHANMPGDSGGKSSDAGTVRGSGN
jgi:hypothetical protein